MPVSEHYISHLQSPATMPRNWLQWRQGRDSQAAGEDNSSAKCGQDIEAGDTDLVDIRNKIEKFKLDSDTRASFISIDSGVFSDFADDDSSEEIDEKKITSRLREWIDKMTDNRRPVLAECSECDGAQHGEARVPADPYQGEAAAGWEGALDGAGRHHGPGTLAFSDGGCVSGTWSHGVR